MVMSLDTAYKTGSSNDYSAVVVVGTLRGLHGGFDLGHYLLDAWRGRVQFGQLKRRVVELQEAWRANLREIGVQSRRTSQVAHETQGRKDHGQATRNWTPRGQCGWSAARPEGFQ